MAGRYSRDDSYPSRSSRGSGRDYSSRDYGGRDYGRSGGSRWDDDDDYRPRSSGSASSRGRGSSGRSSSRRDDYDRDDRYGSGYGSGRSGRGGSSSYRDDPGGRSGSSRAGGGSSSRRPGSPGQPVWGQADARAGSAARGGYGRVGVAAPPRQKRSRRGLWITLGVIGALVVACGGGGVYAMSRYLAPAVAAGTFCGYVEAQGYSQAYAQMSAGAHSQISSTQFANAFAALDTVEGKVTACKAASGSNSYNASPFGSTASAELVMTRATAGALQGSVHLKKESSGWRVDAIDSSLLGVNLGALVAADSYCTALQSQKYADAYALLGAKVQAATKQADFVQLEQWHDTVDGQVSACAVTAFATATAGSSTGTTGGSASGSSGATPTATKSATASATPTGTPASSTSTPTSGPAPSDTSATLTLSLARGKASAQQGALALAVESNAWRIGDVAAELQGSDLSPLQTGGRFCADLAAANYADAYAQVDAFFVGYRTEAQAAALFAGTSASSGGVAWSSCTLDASTYKVESSGARAGYNMTITLTQKATGNTAQLTKFFVLVKTSGVWKLHGYVSAA